MPSNSILLPFRLKNTGDEKNPKLRHLASSIERALASWDSVEEWADYISFIGKLHKAIKSYNGPKDIEIPHGPQVAQRLAQCLDPDLPYGVHQKALELYKTIFELQGPENLRLNVWVPGLFPLMAHASMNVKPILIALFEKYILPLPLLATILRPFLLAVLPGIDDESSESFNDVFSLIENIRDRINDDSYFWQCLFFAIISSADKRLGGLIWCSRRLPEFNIVSNDLAYPDNIPSAYQSLSFEAQQAITPESGLLIRAFCTGLNDEQPLIQRGFLELLVKNLQLQSPVVQVVSSTEDFQLLLLSACTTVLRRDMSLNRRLWNWLLGPEPEQLHGGEPSHLSRSEYFAKYALNTLVSGLLTMIEKDTQDPAEKSRPYRICLSILDRWEIGTAVVPHVLLPIVKSVKSFKAKSETDFEEVLRSAGAFFDGIETVSIWSDCFSLITKHHDLELLLYILRMFNVREEEMVVNHVPLIFLTLVVNQTKDTGDEDLWFSVIDAVLDLIPERAFLPLETSSATMEAEEIIEKIRSFYDPASSSEDPQLPFDPLTLTSILVERTSKLAIAKESSCGKYSKLLSKLLAKLPQSGSWRNEAVVSLLLADEKNATPAQIDGRINLFNVIHNGLTGDEMDKFIFSVVPHLFRYLSRTSGTFQVESVKLLWSLQEQLDDKRVQSAFATLLIDSTIEYRLKSKAFATLWYHIIDRTNSEVILGECLFLYLDLEREVEKERVSLPVWLKRDSQKLLNILIAPIVDENVEEDLEQFLYYSSVLGGVLSCAEEIILKFKSRAKQVTDVLLKRYFLAEISSDLTSQDCVKLLKRILPILTTTEIIEVAKKLQTRYSTEVLGPLRECLFLVSQRSGTNEFDYKSVVDYSLKGLVLASNESQTAIQWIQFVIFLLEYVKVDLIEVLTPICTTLCDCTDEKFALLRQVNNEPLEGETDFSVIPCLLNGIEDILSTASRYLMDDSRKMGSGSVTDSTQIDDSGFFGNVISGVFSVESPMERTNFYNERYDVLKCFELATKTGFKIWTWIDSRGSPSTKLLSNDSIVFILSKVKSRTRHLLAQLYRLHTRQTLECLIMLEDGSSPIFKLIHILDGSRPKSTAPFLLQSITDRTSDGSSQAPGGVLPGMFQSGTSSNTTAESALRSVATDVTVTELSQYRVIQFVCDYLESLENDAVEEVWGECMAFIKEVQASPGQYRLVLPGILSIIAVMGSKVDSSKFGEQKRIRKELSDYFNKLLTYALSRNNGNNSSSTPVVGTPLLDEKLRPESPNPGISSNIVINTGKEELVTTLREKVLPHLRAILNEDAEKVLNTLTTIFQSILSPFLKQKTSSSVVPPYVVELVWAIVNKFPQSTKIWKPIIGDAIFDSRFILMGYPEIVAWMPVIHKWSMADKERIRDYIGRLANYGGNNNLFNWSDQVSISQTNIDRLSLLFLCSRYVGIGSSSSSSIAAGTWTDMVDYQDLIKRFEALLEGDGKMRIATHIFTCLRAIIICVNPSRLAPVVTFIYTQLQQVLSDYAEDKDTSFETVVSACKLLDLILVLNPEEFQMHQWLFVCDNLEDILKKGSSSSLIDALALQATSTVSSGKPSIEENLVTGKPLLNGVTISLATVEDIVGFFHRASMLAYENVYSMAEADTEAVLIDLLNDIDG